MSAENRDEMRMAELLERTSRTFALAIPLLPRPACLEVTLAYLLFRVADTLEDAEYLQRDEKLAALDQFAEVLQASHAASLAMAPLKLPRVPTDNAHEIELLNQLPRLLNATWQLRSAVRESIVASVQRSVEGMQRFIAAGNEQGGIELSSLVELREYCYYVAGIVGEMLTTIFLETAEPLSEVRSVLESKARWFGEGLQLVNILRDAGVDATAGRSFLPHDIQRDEVFSLAREDLRSAKTYCEALRSVKAPPGIIAFADLPRLLAWRTLECVERTGPGAKVPRDQVLALYDQLRKSASSGNSVLPRMKSGTVR